MRGARSSWLARVKARTALLVLLGTALVGGTFALARTFASSGIHEIAGVGTVRVETVQDNGPTSRCVDLVILGDGYLAEDLLDGGVYEQDVGRVTQKLFEPEPLRSYRKWFNLHVVRAPSQARGADNSLDSDTKQTLFDCAFESSDGRGIVVRRGKWALRLAQLAPQADAFLLIVNDARHGGGACDLGNGTRAACFTNGEALISVVHEFGHAFAGLGDEYVESSRHNEHQLPTPYGNELYLKSFEPPHDLAEPNVTLAHFVDTTTAATLEASVKWSHFLSLPGAAGRIGAFEGGFYRRVGVFRPERDCKMRTSTSDFCQVCREAIARRIHYVTGREFDDAAYHAAHPIESR